jgi:DNA replication protein DnaC
VTRGARGLFYDTRDLLKVIRGTYNADVKTTELDILRPVMEADLLVLDDLGAEKTSEWGRGDAESHRQCALQRAPRDDFHLELSRRPAR